MKCSLFLFCVATLFGSPFAAAAIPTTRPVEAIQRVLIISVDGMRPDLMLRARTPVMHALMEGGAFTMWAHTTAVAVTLPSHVSMLTGVVPRKHEIEWNRDLPLSEPIYPKVPTIFELAHKAGYTTAMASGKKKFSALNKPGTLDWSFITATEPCSDAQVATQAVRIIMAHRPMVMFVHLPDVDNVGHKSGWGSPEQLDAIAAADVAIGQVITAERDSHELASTLIIVTADHGGAGLTHGPDDPRSRTIPWIAYGPGLRRGFDLTRLSKLEVNTYDTFATACFALGLPIGLDSDGKPVREIFADIELLEPTTAPATQPTTEPDATQPGATRPSTMP